MSGPITDSLRLKTNRGRMLMLLCVAVIFLVIAVTVFPWTLFFVVLRAIMIPACLLGIVIFMTGIVTNRYDAVLDCDGIEFGTFLKRRRFKWAEIKSVLVINAVSGKEVCLEFKVRDEANELRRPFTRLPDTYGMEAEELAKTLIRWHREYVGKNAQSVQN